MELTDGFTSNIVETGKTLRGVQRRLFMARTVRSLGSGGQRRAELEFGWNRVTIRKGMHELQSGIACCDALAPEADCVPRSICRSCSRIFRISPRDSVKQTRSFGRGGCT